MPERPPVEDRLVYVAAGSNIDAARRMRQAAGLLRERFAGARFSACWQNPAFGFAGEDFVNAVVELPTALALPGLIAGLHDIEARCGRGRDDPKWAPRAMDLDLLLDGDRIESTADYRLPRPDLLKRAYMLLPLAELAGELVHPAEGRSIAALAARWLQDPANAQAAAAMQRMALDLNTA